MEDGFDGVLPVRDKVWTNEVRTERDGCARVVRPPNSIEVCFSGLTSFLQTEFGYLVVGIRLADLVDDGKRGNEDPVSLFQHLDAFVADVDSVFDRVHAISKGVLDPFGTLSVGGDRDFDAVSLLGDGDYLVVSHLAVVRVVFSESTPPVVPILMTSTPLRILLRASLRHSSAPSHNDGSWGLNCLIHSYGR